MAEMQTGASLMLAYNDKAPACKGEVKDELSEPGILSSSRHTRQNWISIDINDGI